jgi:phage tail protein X
MTTISYVAKDLDTIDKIVYQHYGETIAKEGSAVEYLMELNPNIARSGLYLTAGQKLTLPDLPDEIKNQNVKSTINIFE